ncbi:hypothetical protein Q5M85_03575 [Paraclostridium bifermentans]|nr:hypothetical protein [Paraclostridium bifermentans]
MNRPVQSQLVVLGDLSIGGTINKIEELANILEVCFDSGAKKILLPMSSAVDLPTVPLQNYLQSFKHHFILPQKMQYLKH